MELLSVHRPSHHSLRETSGFEGAAVLIASGAGKHITGEILCVDGGLTAVLSCLSYFLTR